jgi:superoxide dismutase, Fe-Mn family
MKKGITSRRDFLSGTAKAGMAITLGSSALSSVALSAYANNPERQSLIAGIGFQQAPLPYSYKALEPIIDTATMEIHYSKHAAGYAKNLNDALITEKADTTLSLEALLGSISRFSEKMRNNAGGHFNHELFWKCMRPPQSDNKPTGALALAIDKKFGSFNNFKASFSDAGKSRFGSGWAWLILNNDAQLQIISSPNQDNPLMDISSVKGHPLLGLDVWEHAYYLKYQNKRADYIENWWQLVNWEYVQERFNTVNP